MTKVILDLNFKVVSDILSWSKINLNQILNFVPLWTPLFPSKIINTIVLFVLVKNFLKNIFSLLSIVFSYALIQLQQSNSKFPLQNLIPFSKSFIVLFTLIRWCVIFLGFLTSHPKYYFWTENNKTPSLYIL